MISPIQPTISPAESSCQSPPRDSRPVSTSPTSLAAVGIQKQTLANDVSEWQTEAENREWSAWVVVSGLNETAATQDEYGWSSSTFEMSINSLQHRRRSLDTLSADCGTLDTASVENPDDGQDCSWTLASSDLCHSVHTLHSIWSDSQSDTCIQPSCGISRANTPPPSSIKEMDCPTPKIPDQPLPVTTPSESSSPSTTNDVEDLVFPDPLGHPTRRDAGNNLPPLSSILPDPQMQCSERMPVQRLTRDETQRQIIMQHYKKSGRLGSGRAIVAQYMTISFLAWISRLMERVKLRAKAD